jgi:ubiquinol-cytochrome c reductase cytochrome c subunit
MLAFTLAGATVLAHFGLRASAAAPDTEAITPPESGRIIFLRECAWCHGPQGEGTVRAPSLDRAGEAGARFFLTTGRMPIDDPADPTLRSPPNYTDETIEAIVEYVLTFADEPRSPDVRPERGDLAHGAELYAAQCAACHAAPAVGAGLTQGVVAPDLGQATPQEIGESIVVGPGAMPRLSPPLDAHDIDSITRYVMAIRDHPEPGGFGLWRIGPFPEGAVTWLFGLGVLVLVIWWIGAPLRHEREKEAEAVEAAHPPGGEDL